MIAPVKINNLDDRLTSGLNQEDRQRILDITTYIDKVYGNRALDYGQLALESARDVGVILADLNVDPETRMAGLLVELPHIMPDEIDGIEERLGSEVFHLVDSVRKLTRLREVTGHQQETTKKKNAEHFKKEQAETLRKMLLAMASDIRVVLIWLAVRVTRLRYLAEHKRQDESTRNFASETMELYAPLANRLGIWQIKWELEDISFRFLEPEKYKKIAKMLEEKRVEREEFIEKAVDRVKEELASIDIKAEVYGRPKHIYSIWNKLRGKSLNFSDMYDVRALRVIVPDVKTCFAVLGVINTIWTPILEEYDDYISRPKANGYQSLHTVVVGEDNLPLEVQIRTEEMHYFAEYGVAAHWRYKESGGSDFVQQRYDEKISWLRQLLAWKTEVADNVAEQQDAHQNWVEKIKATSLEDRIYVLTPQARVIDLPKGATPIDFAYHIHTNIGHACRGARVDGAMVPLNTPLKNAQTVEIMTARGTAGSAGPSRDWLTVGYAASPKTHAKIRTWFNAVEYENTVSQGRSTIEKLLQREGKTAINQEEWARKQGFTKVEEFYLAVGRDKLNLRQLEQSLRGDEPQTESEDVLIAKKIRGTNPTKGGQSGVLVVGTEGLLTQMARCCKPAPPDSIQGFVTRGKGVSIHRIDCKNFLQMQKKSPERVIATEWGKAHEDVMYPVDVFVLASDRQGLLRDISDIFMREKINVIGVRTQSSKGEARMTFTTEVKSTDQLQKAQQMIQEIKGVSEAFRK